MKNSKEDFSARKNTYNSSPITLAEQIYKACEQGNGAAVFLYSGQLLPKEEYLFLDELIGKHTMLNHLPTQSDILLFLGKHSSCMTEPAVVLQIIKVREFWMMHLCRYRKADIGPLVKSVQEVAQIVPPQKEPCVRCEVKRISSEMETHLKEQTLDEKQLAVWSAELYRLIAKQAPKGLIPAKNVVAEFQKKRQEAASPKSNLVGLPTGICEVDRHTGGLAKGELVVLGSRPFMGKTSLAAGIAYLTCVEKNIPVAFFSLELGRNSVLERIISISSKVEIHKLRSGYFSQEDGKRVSKELDRLASSPFFIDDTTGISIAEICFRANRLAEQLKRQGQELGLIIIDYFQLIRPLPCKQDSLKSDYQEREEIWLLLKDLACCLQVPVVVVSQLSRKAAAQQGGGGACTDTRPQLSEVREKGADAADVVILIHRESYYNRDDESLINQAELILAKHPRAFLKNIDVAFFPEYGQFANPDQCENNNTDLLIKG